LHSNAIEILWWGARVSLDEPTTRRLLEVLDDTAAVGSLVAAVDPEVRSKLVTAIVVALVKIGALVIKQVDQQGGSHGVIITHPWVAGPVPGWVVAAT
jgi:hypothetical protein